MTSKHILALALAVMLGLGAGALVLICGRNPLCSAPGVFQAIVMLATSLITLATGIIAGTFGHAKNQDDKRPDGTNSNASIPAVK